MVPRTKNFLIPVTRLPSQPSNMSNGSPSPVSVLHAFHTRVYDEHRVPPIAPTGGNAFPNLSPLDLGQLSTFEDEVSTQYLDSMAERLQEANNIYHSAKPRSVDVTEAKTVSEHEDNVIAHDLNGANFEKDQSSGSDLGKLRTQEVKLEPFPEGAAPRTEHSDEEGSVPTAENLHQKSSVGTEEAGVEVKKEEEIMEEDKDRTVKEEPELVLMENNEGMEETRDETSLRDAEEGSQGTMSNQTVQRGIKRGRLEVETGYWLRSRKPPSSSKRSRRTNYWLRPKAGK